MQWEMSTINTRPTRRKASNVPRLVKEVKTWSSHGMSKTPFYNSWRGMKDRCLNPKSWAYRYYGGRGISISQLWYTFRNFYSDMYASYLVHVSIYGAKETTLD